MDGRLLWLMADFGGDLDVIPPAPAWKAEAACLDVDPDLFFPGVGETTRPAKQVCATCPVTAECLEYGLEVDAGEKSFGVFGGLDAKERRQLARQVA